MLSAVVVSYRSAPLALRFLETLRSEAARISLPLEAIAVVNSGDGDELRALEPAFDRVLDPGANLGFAGGLNAGLAVSRGELFLLANPDLLLRPGALDPLLAPLASHGPVASGPPFHWDEGGTLLMPIQRPPHPFEALRRAVSRDPERGRRLFRLDALRAIRHREAIARGETFEVGALSGALVATSRETLEAVGPFDDGYRLYFEENDWQRRLRLAGGRLLYAGSSRVVHRFNQSARTELRSAAWFAESERRFYLSHFGARGEVALERLGSAVAPGSSVLPLAPDGVLRWSASDAEGRPGPAAVAVSPLPWFHPFALASVPAGARSWTLPREIRAGLDGAWFARAFDAATGEPLSEARIL